MNRLIDALREFSEERDWDQFHSPVNLAKSISIEAGELLECFQWNNEFSKAEVCEELADVLTYAILMQMISKRSQKRDIQKLLLNRPLRHNGDVKEVMTISTTLERY